MSNGGLKPETRTTDPDYSLERRQTGWWAAETPAPERQTAAYLSMHTSYLSIKTSYLSMDTMSYMHMDTFVVRLCMDTLSFLSMITSYLSMKTSPPSKRLCVSRAAKRSLLGYGGNKSSLKHVLACVLTSSPQRASRAQSKQCARLRSRGHTHCTRARARRQHRRLVGTCGRRVMS
jgi:hypothetical protein